MANENSNVVVDRAQSHWSDLWKKEDYWAIWLGFALLIAAICIFINGAPASYKETIDKSNAIMKVEAEKAPFKTIAYIQAQDAKKGVVGTNLPIAKEIKAFIASPGKWTDNPVKSMFTSQAEADAKNAANKEKAEAAKAKAESSFAAAQAAEKLAADAGYKDASLNTAAEAAIKDWTKAKADAFVAAVNSSDDKETAFAELAPDYVSEDDKEDYEADPDASLHTGTVGSSLSYQSFGKWLMDDSRANGDVGVVESSSGYYAVMLVNRYRDETATADIRHILIKASVADADDPATEDVDESKVPTQEALDAAKAEAEDILAQWEAGDKTADSFGALAEQYSDDPGSNTNGGLYEQVAPGVMFEGFNDWIFADGRAIGDTGLVENPQDGQQGWHIIYLEGWDEPVWKLTGKNALTNEKLNTWLEGLTENMEATQGAGVKYLGE